MFSASLFTSSFRLKGGVRKHRRSLGREPGPEEPADSKRSPALAASPEVPPELRLAGSRSFMAGARSEDSQDQRVGCLLNACSKLILLQFCHMSRWSSIVVLTSSRCCVPSLPTRQKRMHCLIECTVRPAFAKALIDSAYGIQNNLPGNLEPNISLTATALSLLLPAED